MNDHFVYISSGGLVALRARADLLELTGRFEPIGGPEGPLTAPRTQAFTNWVQRHKGDRFRIIVDTADEETTLDELPPLVKRDRQEMTRKRLLGRFREQRFKTSMPFALLGEKPTGLAALTGRRASSSLMAALRSEFVLAPWIQIIEGAQIHLQSLHSTALLGPTLTSREFKGKSGLLVSLQPGGLRQTLIVNGVLRFSRLAPVYQLADSGALVNEVESTMQYMAMSQIVSRDLLLGDFSVWAIDAGLPDLDGRLVQVSDSLDPRPITILGSRVKPLRLSEEAQQWHLGAIPYWAAALRLPSAGIGYATGDQRVYAHAAQIRRGLQFGSASLTAACLIAAGGLELFRYMRPDPTGLLKKYEYLISEKEQELQATQAEYGVTGTELNLLTQAAEGLRKRHVDAAALLSTVSTAIGGETDLRLEKISWRRAGSEPNQGTTAAQGPGASPAPVALAATTPAGAGGASGPTGTPSLAGGPAVDGMAPAGVSAAGNVEVIPAKAPTLTSQLQSEVTVEILGKAPKRIGKTLSNQRAEELVARLKAACGCEADLVKWPFDNTPPSTISGDFLAAKSTDQVPFQIRLKLSGAAVSALRVP